MTVGEYDGAGDDFHLDDAFAGSWEAPRDGTLVIIMYRTLTLPPLTILLSSPALPSSPLRVSWTMLVVMSGLAVAGMALAIAFLILNIHFREHR